MREKKLTANHIGNLLSSNLMLPFVGGGTKQTRCGTTIIADIAFIFTYAIVGFATEIKTCVLLRTPPYNYQSSQLLEQEHKERGSTKLNPLHSNQLPHQCYCTRREGIEALGPMRDTRSNTPTEVQDCDAQRSRRFPIL